jgi:neutral ceramidase
MMNTPRSSLRLGFSMLILLGVAAVALSAMSPKPEKPGGPILKVGYGRASITPPLGTPCALGLDDDLLEVFDDLYVRTVWIDKGGSGILISAADVIALYADDVAEFTDAIARATAIPRDRIILHDTHTHQTANSNWQVARILEPYGLSERFASTRFKEKLASAFIETAKAALRDAVPCDMAYASATVRDIASNRRIPVDEKGNVVFRSSRPSEELRRKPEGVIDPLVRLVLFREKECGRMIGICNYNCHPSSAGGDEGPYATGDFPGVGMSLAEQKAGNLRLIHLTGFCGDINPGKYVTSDSLKPEDRKRDVRLMGGRYADAILAAVRSAAEWNTSGSLSLQYESALLPLRDRKAKQEMYRTSLDEAVRSYRELKAAGKTDPGALRRVIFHYHALLRGRKDAITARPAVLRLGDTWFSFLPGEIFLQLGSELRKDLKDAQLLNVSNCFDSSVGYVVPAECYDKGGYEVGATRLAPPAYGNLRAAAEKAIRELNPAE